MERKGVMRLVTDSWCLVGDCTHWDSTTANIYPVALLQAHLMITVTRKIETDMKRKRGYVLLQSAKDN